MATVYLARDLKLNRLVAVKVLRPELAAALGVERFLREIEIAANLSHPHILQLYDSGEADGLLFFVMPFVDGESLRQRLEREGRLPIGEAVRLAAEVAAALDYAHQQGIVHRDIKPENILLHTGQAVVSDFGIARAIDAAAGGTGRTALTATGIVIGTPLYMCPEQIAGGTVDGRSDVYSLGCVLYEMLAGDPPYSGPSAQAVLARHTVDPIPSVRRSRPDAPVAVERTIAKALAKVPEDRFASAAAFRDALTGAAPAPKAAWRWPMGRRATLALTLVAASVAALVTGYALRTRRPAGGSSEPVPSVAVLAFKNIGDDAANEPFSDGMSDEITTALGRVAGLRVSARSTAFSFKGRGIVPREIGRQLHVRYVLDGGVRVSGTRRRVSVQLINVTDGNEVWSDDYDRDARDRDVFAVQDSIAGAIVASLRVHLSGTARAALTSRSTENPEAHDLYLKGRYFWNQRSSPFALQRSIGFFQQAIALDSGYARAWAGLAEAYSLLPVFANTPPAESFTEAKAAAQRAVTLDSTLADAHTSLGIIAIFHDWDWATAGREFDRALAIDSTEPTTHLFRAWLFVCQGQFDGAVTEVRTAQRLDPLNPVINARLGSVLSQARRYTEAEGAYRQALALDSTNVGARSELGALLAVQHRFPEAMAIFRTLEDTTNLNRQAGWQVAAQMGYVYGLAGRRAEAVKIQHYLTQRARTHYVMPQAFALVALGLGDTARALDWLERGYRERSSLIVFLAGHTYDSLRGEPRFQRIVRGIGITLPPVSGGRSQ